MSETTTDGNKNSVVKKRPAKDNIGLKEKEQVVKLIDSRLENALGYLRDMKEFANGATGRLPFSKQEVIDTLTTEQLTLNTEQVNIEVTLKDLEESAYTVLKRKWGARIDRLEALRIKYNAEWDEAKDEVRQMLADRRAQRSSILTKRLAEINTTLETLRSDKSGEQELANYALGEGFSRLSDELRDRRNKAVEKVWTDCHDMEDAKDILTMLPDAVTVRDNVPAQVLIDGLHKVVTLPLLEATKDLSKLACRQCGNIGSVKLTDGSGYRVSQGYCTKCRSRNAMPLHEQLRVMPVPKFEDIIKKTREPVLALTNSQGTEAQNDNDSQEAVSDNG